MQKILVSVMPSRVSGLFSLIVSSIDISAITYCTATPCTIVWTGNGQCVRDLPGTKLPRKQRVCDTLDTSLYPDAGYFQFNKRNNGNDTVLPD